MCVVRVVLVDDVSLWEAAVGDGVVEDWIVAGDLVAGLCSLGNGGDDASVCRTLMLGSPA